MFSSNRKRISRQITSLGFCWLQKAAVLYFVPIIRSFHFYLLFLASYLSCDSTFLVLQIPVQFTICRAGTFAQLFLLHPFSQVSLIQGSFSSAESCAVLTPESTLRPSQITVGPLCRSLFCFLLLSVCPCFLVGDALQLSRSGVCSSQRTTECNSALQRRGKFLGMERASRVI